MNHLSHAALAVAVTLGLAHGLANAQATAPAKKASKSAPAKKAPPAKKAAPAPAALMPADQAQLDAAERTYFGNYVCELDQSIDVGMNPKTPGYVDVKFKSKTYTMKPVVSSTGALRLEGVKGDMLLIQIANKSMMMDTKVGQRVVDGCVNEKQRDAAALAAKT
ncbi:MAG: hypothetical protein ABI671_13160 [Burkholderiales bacterium]